MKKLLSLVLIVSIIMSSLALSVFFTAAEEEEAHFVRFTATGNDPCGTLKFSTKGNNTHIDPDTVTWASIRYRVNNPKDSTGVDYKGQIYGKIAEPHVPIIWDVSEGWHTIVVDLTTVSETSSLESIWNSEDYTNTSIFRFDPLEPDRDAELNQQGQGGEVNEGDSLDVVWIAFFEKEEDAKAYTGKEDTPYCLVSVDDVDSLLDISGESNLKTDEYVNGVKVVTEELEEFVVNKSLGSNAIQINNNELAIKTIEIPENYVMREFTLTSCPTWSNTNGDSDVMAEVYIWKGDYDSTYVGKPVATVEVLDHIDNSPCKFKFNNELRYGHEYLIVITTINDGAFGYWEGESDLPEGWVVYMDGEESESVPPMSYALAEVGDLGPEPTEEPTEEPTDTPEITEAPEATATAEVTAAPADETAEATAGTSDDDGGKSGCGSFIGGSSLIIVALAAFVAIKRKH